MSFGVKIRKVEINEKKNITYQDDRWLYVGTMTQLQLLKGR